MAKRLCRRSLHHGKVGIGVLEFATTKTLEDRRQMCVRHIEKEGGRVKSVIVEKAEGTQAVQTHAYALRLSQPIASTHTP